MGGLRSKFVSSSELIPGQEVTAIRLPRGLIMLSQPVLRVDNSGVVLKDYTGKEAVHPLSAQYEVEMSEDEFRTKYRRRAKKVMAALCNKMANYEIGPHEMWNAWLSNDPYEMAAFCEENHLRVLGYCTDILPKVSMFGDDYMDVGICAEESDGTKLWCHFFTETLRYMFDEFADIAPAENPWKRVI